MNFVFESVTGVTCGVEYLADEEIAMITLHLFIVRLTFSWENN